MKLATRYYTDYISGLVYPPKIVLEELLKLTTLISAFIDLLVQVSKIFASVCKKRHTYFFTFQFFLEPWEINLRLPPFLKLGTR